MSTSIRYPATAAGSGVTSVAAVGSTPSANGASISGSVLTLQPADATHPGVMSAADKVTVSAQSGTNTGDVTLAAVGSAPSANGASLSGQALTLQPADATHPGVLTTGTQTIAGAKTLSGGITLGSAGITFNDATTQTTAPVAPTIATFGSSPTANGATISGSAITLQPADATHPGLLTTGAQAIAGNKSFSGNLSCPNGIGNGSGSSGATQGLQFSGSNTYIVAAGSSFNAGFIANNGAHFLIATPSGISELGNGGPSITMGTGSPAGAVTAVVGSLYLRTDGGANTTLYVKESGTGTSGWVAK